MLFTIAWLWVIFSNINLSKGFVSSLFSDAQSVSPHLGGQLLHNLGHMQRVEVTEGPLLNLDGYTSPPPVSNAQGSLLVSGLGTAVVFDANPQATELGLVSKQSLCAGSSSESPTIYFRVDGTRTSAVPFGAEEGRGAVLASSGLGDIAKYSGLLYAAGQDAVEGRPQSLIVRVALGKGSLKVGQGGLRGFIPV
jgi:hypothetical protein